MMTISVNFYACFMGQCTGSSTMKINKNMVSLMLVTLQDLILTEHITTHFSERVFFHDDKVYKFDKIYKFYEKNDAKVHNAELMKSLGYFKDVEVKVLSDEFTLCSYKYIQGSLEPAFIQQIYAIAKIVEAIHAQQMVHADIKCGNLEEWGMRLLLLTLISLSKSVALIMINIIKNCMRGIQKPSQSRRKICPRLVRIGPNR